MRYRWAVTVVPALVLISQILGATCGYVPHIRSSDDVTRHENIYLLPWDCGQTINSRIDHGSEAGLFDFPWLALIVYNDSVPRCGGSIISEYYVLTAAHCVAFLDSSLYPASVMLGEHHQMTDKDCKNDVCMPIPQNISIKETIPHKNFTGKSDSPYDIALIRLSNPANFSYDSVKPLCLPIGPQQQTLNLLGKNLALAGWGLTEKGKESNILLNVTIPVIDCSKCYPGPLVNSSDSQICAGGNRTGGANVGDSGGPLTYPVVIDGISRFIQYGIVSFRADYPESCAVYCHVNYFMEWILNNMKP